MQLHIVFIKPKSVFLANLPPREMTAVTRSRYETWGQCNYSILITLSRDTANHWFEGDIIAGINAYPADTAPVIWELTQQFCGFLAGQFQVTPVHKTMLSILSIPIIDASQTVNLLHEILKKIEDFAITSPPQSSEHGAAHIDPTIKSAYTSTLKQDFLQAKEAIAAIAAINDSTNGEHAFTKVIPTTRQINIVLARASYFDFVGQDIDGPYFDPTLDCNDGCRIFVSLTSSETPWFVGKVFACSTIYPPIAATDAGNYSASYSHRKIPPLHPWSEQFISILSGFNLAILDGNSICFSKEVPSSYAIRDIFSTITFNIDIVLKYQSILASEIEELEKSHSVPRRQELLRAKRTLCLNELSKMWLALFKQDFLEAHRTILAENLQFPEDNNSATTEGEEESSAPSSALRFSAGFCAAPVLADTENSSDHGTNTRTEKTPKLKSL